MTEFKTHPSNPNVHLHFDYQSNYDLGNHYQPIIKTNTHIKIEQFTPPEHSQVTPEKRNPYVQDINYDTYCKEFRFSTHLFVGPQPTPVDFIPGNIDGMKLYKISNVQEKNCWKSAADLRHFKMNTSKRKDLEGRRKVGICSGSYECPNDNCPFLNS